MLTLLLSVLVNVGWGQINTEYRFIQYNVPDTYPHEQQDTIVNLTMDCLAANGYGQWTASSQTNTQPTTDPENPTTWPQSGWFLLGNRIDKSINPTGSTAKSTPPGVVDKGTFGDVTYPAHMKVAANLDSRVRYVWPNPTGGRNTFKVFGLSERSSPFTLTDQIDISFAGFPNPPISRKVVREPITPYTNAATNNKPVSNEVFWQDEFDIAIDKNYLYIVWSTDVPFGGVGREVWATVLDLVNGLPINGNYPMRISVDGHKPTVACDVRNTGGEKFHVSCIGKTIPNIQLYDVQAAITTPIALSNFYDDPDGGPQIPLTNITHARVLHATLQEAPSFITALYVIADQNLLLYNNALTGVNAKYVDGDRIPPVKPCVEKASPFEGYKVKDAPIVAFTDPYGGDIAQPPFFNQFHVLYQLDNPTIEGQVVPRFPLVIVRNYDNGFTVPGSPKTRLCLNVNSGIAEADVENATVPAPTEEFIPASIHNDDPDTYVAAVNQMGIHVHWRTAGTNPTHFYARDINRTFNENIEEHTLVSNDCWVGDHTPLDGASGATVLPGKRLTVWSDPNWGYANNGVLASNLNLVNRGKLKFKGNNVALHIGIPNYTEGQPSKLVTLSHFLCVFPSAYSNQVLQVNSNATWDFLSKSSSYSNSINYTYSGFIANDVHSAFITDPQFLTEGSGKIVFSGVKENSIVFPAILNIHSGTSFFIPNGTILSMNYSEVNSLFESSIYPTNLLPLTIPGSSYYVSGEYLNPPEISKVAIVGQTVINNSFIKSYFQNPKRQGSLPVNVPYIDYVFGTHHTIKVKAGWTGTSGYNLDVNNTYFRNISSGVWEGINTDKGFLSIFFTGNTSAGHYKEVRFDQCTFESAIFRIEDPVKSVLIEQSSFNINEGLFGLNWIDFRRGKGLDYKDILIDRCTLVHDLSPDAILSVRSMINFEGYDLHHLYDLEPGVQRNRIHINECNFEASVPYSLVNNAIELKNSSAAVTFNIVSGQGLFTRGIYCYGTGPTPPSLSTSICSNVIDNCRFTMDGEDIGAGIRTENWFGYAKLNKISNCQWGHIAGYKVVNAGILFSNYHDNRRADVLLKSNAVVDFSGVHSSVFNNYEAKNTFEYNNTDNNDDPQDDPEVGGQLEFASDASTAKMVFETDETGLDFDPIDAKNNITRNSELDNYIYAPFSKTVLTIDSNYWENGIGNSNPPPSTSTALMPFKNITYPNGPASHTLLQEFSDITCGDPIATLTTWLADRQQAQSVDTNLPCKSLYGLGVNRFNQQRWQESYDAHKQYIEQCASDWDSYSAFTNMVVSNQMRSTDNNRYPQHLHWLKKVLYYSFDTLYYCENVVSMLNTFRFFDSTYGKYTEGAMTVARYMMDSAHCDYFDNEIIEDLKEGMEELYVKWRDTVQDSIATPFNPQFPSLEDLDLTILRGPQNSVTPATHEPRLGELIATRNPFTDILELKYSLSKSAMTRIDVYDLLGKTVYSEGQGYKPEGEHILSLQMKGWVAGSYYVRLSSPSGEVKTVKVVKE